MRLLIPILAVLLLASCRTTKTLTETRLVTDSTTERALREHARMLEEEIRSGSRDSAIRYITDVQFEECDSAAAPATVVFDNGKLASVTGQLRSVRQQLSEEASERYYQSYRADSLQEMVDSMRTTVRVEYVDKVREVKRAYIPLWVWFLIAALAGLVLRAYWPRLLHIFKPKTYSMFPLFLLGTWPVGLLLLAGAAIFMYLAYRASRSGSSQQTDRGTVYSDKNVPIHKTGWFMLGMGCILGFIAYLIIQIGER